MTLRIPNATAAFLSSIVPTAKLKCPGNCGVSLLLQHSRQHGMFEIVASGFGSPNSNSFGGCEVATPVVSMLHLSQLLEELGGCAGLCMSVGGSKIQVGLLTSTQCMRWKSCGGVSLWTCPMSLSQPTSSTQSSPCQPLPASTCVG